MNAKARLTASDDLEKLSGVSDKVMDLLDAAVGGHPATVTAEALGQCIALKMCAMPEGQHDPRARSICLDTGNVTEVIITQKGLDCYAALAAS